MKKEIRTVCYDEELRLEAYRLRGGAGNARNIFDTNRINPFGN